MPVTTYTVAEFARARLGFRLDPRSQRAWKPPAGTAALEFVNKPGVRQFSVVCQHGGYVSTFEGWRSAVALFTAAHAECPIASTRKEWWPAQAAVRASFGVTATPDPAAQRALAEVRAAGARTEAFLIVNRCRGCTPGYAETNPIGHPEAATLELVHASDCRANGRRDG